MRAFAVLRRSQIGGVSAASSSHCSSHATLVRCSHDRQYRCSGALPVAGSVRVWADVPSKGIPQLDLLQFFPVGLAELAEAPKVGARLGDSLEAQLVDVRKTMRTAPMATAVAHFWPTAFHHVLPEVMKGLLGISVVFYGVLVLHRPSQ